VGYDVFIFGLTILGISTVVVFSYKIFHSRVYPVGMVRKVPESQEYADVGDLRLSAQEQGMYYSQRTAWKKYAKRDLRGRTVKLHYKLSPAHYLPHKFETEHAFTFYLRASAKDPAQKGPVEHEEALKLHSRLEDLEKRIRQLEIETVQKVQEAAEEKAQPPHVVH